MKQARAHITGIPKGPCIYRTPYSLLPLAIPIATMADSGMTLESPSKQMASFSEKLNKGLDGLSKQIAEVKVGQDK